MTKVSTRKPDPIVEDDTPLPEKPSKIDFKITFNGLPKPKRIAKDEEE